MKQVTTQKGYTMTGVKLSIEHNGVTYPGAIMRIKSTSLGREDHGIFTAYLHCEAPGFGVGVGGYGLDSPVEVDGRFSHREGSAYGLDHVIRIMETVGVSSWEKVAGQDVIVLSEPTSGGGWGSMSVGIASLDGSRVLVLKAHAEEWKTAHAEAVSA